MGGGGVGRNFGDSRIPKPDNPAWELLARAYDKVHDMELLPMRDAESCAARAMINEAAAGAIGVSLDQIAEWRRRLAAEPTITGVRSQS